MKKEHIVKSYVKLCKWENIYYVAVVFRDNDEIEKMIAALKQLRKPDSLEAHFHLQDDSYEFDEAIPGAATEVSFNAPCFLSTEAFTILQDIVSETEG